jgi:hypothetical protein
VSSHFAARLITIIIAPLVTTKLLLSGISAGIKVKTDRNQQDIQTKTGIPDRQGIEKCNKIEATTPAIKKNQV